jgi:hypothetical protein
VTLHCPFCGSGETERITIEGHRFLVFGCMFTPEVDPGLGDAEITALLATTFGPQGTGYFRRTCDALHVHVTKGEGARVLTAPRPPPSS